MSDELSQTLSAQKFWDQCCLRPAMTLLFSLHHQHGLQQPDLFHSADLVLFASVLRAYSIASFVESLAAHRCVDRGTSCNRNSDGSIS